MACTVRTAGSVEYAGKNGQAMLFAPTRSFITQRSHMNAILPVLLSAVAHAIPAKAQGLDVAKLDAKPQR